MRYSTIHSNTRNYGRATNQIVVERERHARLRCGHEVFGVPLVTLGSRRWFRCPDCGLQRALTK